MDGLLIGGAWRPGGGGRLLARLPVPVADPAEPLARIEARDVGKPIRQAVELPFGGVGQSGHGREKGLEARYGFSALKTVAHHHG